MGWRIPPAPPTGPPVPRGPAVGTAGVTEYVFDDADGDGVADPGESGVGNVAVTVTDESGLVHVGTPSADGHVSVGALPAGRVTVVVTPPDGAAVTTGNAVQALTVRDIPSALPGVGLHWPGAMTGTVYADTDGDGSRAGDEVAIPDVVVTVTDARGAVRVVSSPTPRARTGPVAWPPGWPVSRWPHRVRPC